MKPVKFWKLVLALNCSLPLLLLVWDAWQGKLGANPINFAIRTTGLLCILGLIGTLLVTPLARLSRRPALGQYRRILGLTAFFYGAIHHVQLVERPHDSRTRGR